MIRILEVNPSLGLQLAGLVDQPDDFDSLYHEALTILGGTKKIATYKESDQPFTRIKDIIGDYKVVDTVRVEASGITEVMQIKNSDGKNYRVWRHYHDSLSGGEDSGGVETNLYEEDPTITAYEMGWME